MREDITQTRVVVLGAGLVGLAASDRLIHKGEKPIVIEKENAVGGLCRSFKHDGFTFDLGGHRFLPHNKDIADFVSILFNNNELCLRERRSKIYLKKRFVLYPPEFSDILRNLGLVTCFKCGMDYIYFRLKHLILKKPEISLKDWLINKFGYTLYKIYFGPYSFKLWGREPSNISSEWAPQRISVPHIGVAIKSLFVEHHMPLKTYARKFLYPIGGIGEIPGRMAEEVIKKGSSIFINHRVTKIVVRPNGFVIGTVAPEGLEKIFFTSKIISSIPLTEILTSLHPRPPQEVLDSANSLRFRSIRFLNLMLDVSHITDNTWLYIPEREYVFFRIQEFSNWHPHNSPPGKTALTLEIACEKGGRLWNMKDPELLKTCIKDLKKMGINLEGKVIDYFSTFLEHAYPVYSLRYKDHLQKIYDYVESIKNLVICGRQGLFRYINMDAAIENGFEAAESLYDEKRKINLLRWKDKREYLETNLYLDENE